MIIINQLPMRSKEWAMEENNEKKTAEVYDSK